MENRAHAIMVGLFTLLLVLAAIFSYWWLSGSRQELANYTIVSQLPVTGLSVESSVKFRGVSVGKVADIHFEPSSQTTILITITVPDSLQLSQNTFAELRMQGITGLSYIDLNVDPPQEGKPDVKLATGSRIVLRPSFVDDLLKEGPKLMSQIEVLIASTSKLSDTANQLVSSIDPQKLNRSLDNLEKSTASIQPALDSASVVFKNMAQLTSDKNQQQLLQTLGSLKQASDSVKPLVVELSTTVKDYTAIAGRVEVNTTQVLDRLNNETLPQIHLLTQTTDYELKHFGQLIDILQDNPQSLIFGRPIAQPGPGEAGFHQ